MRRQLPATRFLLLIIVSLIGWSAARAASDADVLTFIESLRPIAAQLKMDGLQTDWSGLPFFAEPSGDAAGDRSRDITGVAIAPRENDLVILVTTADSPSKEDLAFSIEIDFMGRSRPDVRIDLNQQEPHRLTVFPEAQNEILGNVTGLEVAFGEVVEVRIPYSALARSLPAAEGLYDLWKTFKDRRFTDGDSGKTFAANEKNSCLKRR